MTPLLCCEMNIEVGPDRRPTLFPASSAAATSGMDPLFDRSYSRQGHGSRESETMPRNVLQGISPKLAELAEAATDEQKRAICVPICKLAVTGTGLNEPLVTKALQLLENGAFKDRQVTS